MSETEETEGDVDPWVRPPEEGEWQWHVEARTEGGELLAIWTENGRHRADAKQRFEENVGRDVVEWGRTYPAKPSPSNPRPDPGIDWMEDQHTWCASCGDYVGDRLYEMEHAEHDVGPVVDAGP